MDQTGELRLISIDDTARTIEDIEWATPEEYPEFQVGDNVTIVHPEFQVGDKVTIRYENDLVMEFAHKDTGEGLFLSIPPFGFNSDMLKLCGRTATIIEANFIPFDRAWEYEIDIDEEGHSWSYDMFKEGVKNVKKRQD